MNMTEATLTTDSVDAAHADVLAAEWLAKKEIERAGQDAEDVRKAVGDSILALVGKDGIVNPFGNRRYRVAVTERNNASLKTVLDALVARHPKLADEVATLTEASKTSSVSVALKPVKD